MLERHAKVVTTRTLPFAPSEILAIVQDPPQLIHFNPLVTSCKLVSRARPSPAAADHGMPESGNEQQLGEEVETWEIEDQMHLCGLIPMRWTYSAAFERTATGVLVHPKAGMGVRLENLWTVEPVPAPGGGGGESERKGEEGGKTRTQVTESADIWAPFGLLGFVKGTLRKAHEELMGALERRLEDLERMRREEAVVGATA